MIVKHDVFGTGRSRSGFYVWLKIRFLVYFDLNILADGDYIQIFFEYGSPLIYCKKY